MALAEPYDWSPGETVTAALMDQEIGDQFKQTGAYQAANKGELLVASAAKTVGVLTPVAGRILIADSGEALGLRWSEVQEAVVATSQARASTSYGDLATAGPEITVDVGSSGIAEIEWQYTTGNTSGSDAEAFANVRVNSDDPQSTTPVNHFRVVALNGFNNDWNFRERFTGLTPGNNTFKMRYRTDGTSVNFANRKIRGWSL